MRSAPAKSWLGAVYPAMPAMATTTSTAGDTSLASTAAEPTTSPPRMETVCPMEEGRRSPASWSTSKASSITRISVRVEKGTSALAAMMDRDSLTGISSGSNSTAAAYSPGRNRVMSMHTYRRTDSAPATAQLVLRSWPVRKKLSRVAGNSHPMGMPSTITPTRPSASPVQKRSGLSV